MDVSGKTIVVVGGASGIGHAVAKAAVTAGARAVIVGRNPRRLAASADTIGSGVTVETADACEETSIVSAFARIGRFDHLVITTSVSGISLGVQTTSAKMPLDRARLFFEGKFWAQYTCARAALAHLASDGSIGFTSGVASRKGLPHHTIIAANNAAIEAMAKQLAREIGPRRVYTVSPGLTATSVYDHLSEAERKNFFAHITGQLPIPRPATPEEIAHAYLFAMTSSYLTGAVIDIDGGLLVN